MSAEALSSVASHSIADTIYEIDKFGEEAIRGWFEAQWPGAEPVEVVMEGLTSPFAFHAEPLGRTPNGNVFSTQSMAPAQSCTTSAVPGRCPDRAATRRSDEAVRYRRGGDDGTANQEAVAR